MKKFLLTIIAFISITMSADAQKLYATPGALPGGANAGFGRYTWSENTNNLLTFFEFPNGELANYTTLTFTFSNLVDGPVRMGYFLKDDSNFHEFGNGYYNAGTKTVDLTALGIDLSTVTKIAFGGRSKAGSCYIAAKDVYLTGNNNTLYAAPGSCGGSATYFDYGWTATTNNLWPQFEFSNGELANYTTLKFTLTFAKDAGMVRMGYFKKDDSNFYEFGNGFGSDGTKTVDLTGLGIDLSTVTKIAFGGRSGGSSNTGAVNLRNVYLEGSNKLELTDGVAYPFTNSADFTATTATYSRTCSSQWGTLCLPFEINRTYDGVTFYNLSMVEDDVMYFTSVSGSIAAGTPVVFKMNSTNATLSISETEVAVVSNPVDVANGSWTMQGTFTSQDFMYGYSNYYYIAGDEFWNDGFTAAPYRGWFVGPASSSAPYRISTGDDTEGLQYVEQEDGSVKVYYDIQGRKADSTRKGLVIENGKVMMIK